MAEAKLTKNDKTLLERVLKDPVVYTYAPCVRGGTHAKLVRSSISISQRKHLDRFALAGLVAKKESGDPAGCPPEMSIIYSMTALGREALDVLGVIAPLKNHTESATDTQLLAEAQGA